MLYLDDYPVDKPTLYRGCKFGYQDVLLGKKHCDSNMTPLQLARKLNEKDLSVKMTCSTTEMHTNSDKGDFIDSTETTKGLNHFLNDDSSTVANCYESDSESTNSRKKVFRKRFGKYPDYRIRFNGIPWMDYDTTDVGSHDENSGGENDVLRTARQSKRTRKKHKSCKPPHIVTDSISSIDESNDEESEQMVVHVTTGRKKRLVKYRRGPDEVQTTSTSASDKESLTGCSLCSSN